MYYNLYLDDVRFPKDSLKWCKEQPLVEWVIVRNYNQFVEIIKQRGVPNHISFDNDLSDFDAANAKTPNYQPKEKTGYDCAKFLVNYCQDNNVKFPHYTVHSMNPVGKENIITLIESYKRICES